MDSHSQNTLDRVGQNDRTLTHLQLGDKGIEFDSGLSSDFSQLGAAVGQNTHLTELS